MFKLAVCQAGGLRSCFQRFFRYAAEILQLLDLVVSLLHLNGNVIFYFDEIELCLGKYGAGVSDLSHTLSAVEKVISEGKTKCAEVVDKKGNTALIAISREAGNVGNIGVLCSCQARFRFYESLLCRANLRAVFAGDADTF